MNNQTERLAFQASNGLSVERDQVGGVGVSWSSPRNEGWTFHDPEESKALQEFFANSQTEPAFMAEAIARAQTAVDRWNHHSDDMTLRQTLQWAEQATDALTRLLAIARTVALGGNL